MKDFETFANEILQEIIEEEKAEKERREIILKNSCPCTEKVERIGTFTKKHFLECPICFKQFHLDGTEITDQFKKRSITNGN